VGRRLPCSLDEPSVLARFDLWARFWVIRLLGLLRLVVIVSIVFRHDEMVPTPTAPFPCQAPASSGTNRHHTYADVIWPRVAFPAREGYHSIVAAACAARPLPLMPTPPYPDGLADPH
jgi:hypothetical protein